MSPAEETFVSVADAPAFPVGIEVQHLSAWYRARQALCAIDLAFPAHEVTALIGPSGCGKSTFVRCLNRLHETLPGARVSGKVLVAGVNIYQPGVDVTVVRRHVGMVFQRPNPIPTMTIYENVAIGMRLLKRQSRAAEAEQVEQSLRAAALWNEVKDGLNRPSTSLSGGQQQRLCIARAVAVRPTVLLLDEPSSALDPIATLKIEELLRDLQRDYTIVIVTHNMQQASRVARYTGFFLNGKLIEFDLTEKIFTKPTEKQTEDYITGRFG